MLDIIYSEINRLRDAKQNKEEQLNIAKQLVKKALLKYYLDWDSYRKSVQYNFSNADDILLDYANMSSAKSVAARFSEKCCKNSAANLRKSQKT
jgi:hypothetical protein